MNISFGVPCNKLLIIIIIIIISYYNTIIPIMINSYFSNHVLCQDVLEGGILKDYGCTLFYSTRNLQWTCTKKC